MKKMKIRVTIPVVLLLVFVLMLAPAIATAGDKCNQDNRLCEKELTQAISNDVALNQHTTGSISGMKFNDLNGNSQQDPGELGLEGWTIRLVTGIGGSVIGTTTTDSDGKYIFRDVPFGSYTVWEVINTGWIQTYPGIGEGSFSWGWIVAVDGDETGYDFGNFRLGEINGMKFNDLNGNSRRDAGETGLVGWTITLTGKDEITGQQVTRTAVTDLNGDYKITGLTKGTYTLKETLQPGWIQTFPGVSKDDSSVWSVTISNSGQGFYGINFGNFKLSEINGMKFNDLNGNSRKDAGETGLQGWTITVTGRDEITGEQVTKTAETDLNGNYKITGLTKGTYAIKETLKPGWIQTYPSVSKDGSATYYIKVSNSGQGFVFFDFGNFKLGEINGMKFNDINGNSIKDRGDPGLKGWTITLTGRDEITGEQVTKTAETDVNGNYKFTNLTIGTYIIKEILQPGWIQTVPRVSETGSITYTSRISNSGQELTGLEFGNFKFGAIRGKKWDDLNANGKIDSFEESLPGWTITLTGTDTITNTPVSRTATTDSNGNYEFKGLTAGTYTVTETLKTDWVQTAPVGGSYTLTITSGTEHNWKDFGNFHKGRINGIGTISISPNGEGAFGLAGKYILNEPEGSVLFADNIKDIKIQSTQIKTVATSPDKKKGVITGIALVNGKDEYPYEVYVEDNTGLLPGTKKDVFRISLPTYPYSAGNDLSNGDIQILK